MMATIATHAAAIEPSPPSTPPHAAIHSGAVAARACVPMTESSRRRRSSGVGRSDGAPPARRPSVADHTVSSEEKRSVEAEEFGLLPGERLLWEGRPTRHRLLRRPDGFPIHL